MLKFNYALLVATSVLSVSGVMADEVTQSSSTKVDSPDYSASRTSTTTQSAPSVETRESTTTTNDTPYSQEVTSKKEYRTAPCRKSNTTITRESSVNR